MYEYYRKNNLYTWVLQHYDVMVPDVSRIKQAFLYNKHTSELITYLDVLDPIHGKIPKLADQEITYKTFYDPAIYAIGDTNVNVDEGMQWTSMQEGALWWDLRTAKFIDSYNDDIIYRNSSWSTLAAGASIDIYEWVKTDILPSEWDLLTDTDTGISLGISGSTLYGDNAYSIVKTYDNISKTFARTYYYWVKNKKTVPEIIGRSMSAQDVSKLIGNPRGQGYQFLSLTGLNSFGLTNVKQLLKDQEVVLSVEYWTGSNDNQKIHSQWKLISSEESTTIPSNIEQKWIDSLCGKDKFEREVPDSTLPIKIRYGIENRPRQGMFVNRFEALKQCIEHINSVLIKNLITDTRDLTKLQSYDAEPHIIRGLYDTILDTDAELRFTNISTFKRCVITPVLVDGRITDILITDPGRGYLIEPFIEVHGSGEGAKLRAKINSTTGQIIGVDILSAGYGYDDNTTLTIRDYSVLVHNDSQAAGNWSIYSYDPTTAVWSRTHSQTYNTTRFWSYTDWYDTGYNQFVSIDHAVDILADVQLLEVSVGEVVKVRTTHTGNWMLLLKTSSVVTNDWFDNYKIIGSQNGTIQLSSSIYSFIDTTVGYDGSLFDNLIYDNSASLELRIILETIKNDILINELKPEYLNLFFIAIRYAMSEQTYVDWVFKTSFVKATHNVGNLDQTPTYKNDNLQNFEDYVAEVKPYRTQIREYVSAYGSIDTTETSIIDFDMPPVYTGLSTELVNTYVKDGVIVADNNAIQQYPWKHWLDNVGFKITEIKITDGGSGYISNPSVRIISNTGTGATANAYISNGMVNRIILLTTGTGYLSAPTIIIDGGLGDGGVSATAVAIIGKSVVRSTLVKMKFDRITSNYYLTTLAETETFVGTGSRVQYPLRWGPDVRTGKTSVTVNGVDILRDTYKLRIVSNNTRGYTSYTGSIIFDSAPAYDSTVVITYLKDWGLLNAADRIQYYYNPQTGDLGKDLSQLMTGIDYGGVLIDGLGFNTVGGWDSTPYYSDKWDSFDPSYDDYIVTVAENTHSFTLPYVPEDSTAINVYHVIRNIETHVSDGVTREYTFDSNKDVSNTIVSVTRSVHTTGTNSVGLNVLQLADVTGISIGDLVSVPNFSSNGDTIIATAVAVDTNYITVNNTSGLLTGMLLTFGGYGIGELQPKRYYVKTIVDNTHITLSSTPNGAVVDFTMSATGQMTAVLGGIFGYGTYVTDIEVDANIITLSQMIYTSIPTGTEIVFSHQLHYPTDVVLYTTGKMVLTRPIVSGNTIIIDGLNKTLRIDDPLYGTPEQTNTNAVMTTPIIGVTPAPEVVIDQSTGVTIVTINVPNTVDVNEGDKFIFRKSTSDGSSAITTNYDVSLSGGTFQDGEFVTAVGYAADDVYIDGDDFISSNTSLAPEEVVPGQVVDCVGIKVFDRPSNGAAKIRVENHNADGITTVFGIGQTPNSSEAVIVKLTTYTLDNTDVLTSNTLIKTLGVDYTVDYRNNNIRFITPPEENSTVSVYSIGVSGSNILATGYEIANGVTSMVVTDALWNNSFSYLVYLDGTPVNANVLEESNKIAFQFGSIPPSGTLINYVILKGIAQTFAVTKVETITANGGSMYLLANNIGDSLPIESNMIVRVDQTILQGPSNNYITIDTNTDYLLDPLDVDPVTFEIGSLYLIVEGNALILDTDYMLNIDMVEGVTIILEESVRAAHVGQVMNASIAGGGYVYIPASTGNAPRILFDVSYSAPKVIEIVSSYRHDSLDIHVINSHFADQISLSPDSVHYYGITNQVGGQLKLDRTVIDDNYVWVVKNGSLLIPSIDFTLNDDKKSITVVTPILKTDNITIMTYGSNLISDGIAYMQFKDMLNRVHYKRLSLNKQTELVKDLNWNDLSIEVLDASNFERPNTITNVPGIIEIRGERIEYFAITGNVISKLRSEEHTSELQSH